MLQITVEDAHDVVEARHLEVEALVAPLVADDHRAADRRLRAVVVVEPAEDEAGQVVNAGRLVSVGQHEHGERVLPAEPDGGRLQFVAVGLVIADKIALAKISDLDDFLWCDLCA